MISFRNFFIATLSGGATCIILSSDPAFAASGYGVGHESILVPAQLMPAELQRRAMLARFTITPQV